MEAISWAFKPTIQSVHPQEPQVLAWRESIASTLTAALHPARQYIAKVQAYCSWLVLDPVAYVEALQVSKLRRVWLTQLCGCMLLPHQLVKIDMQTSTAGVHQHMS